MPIRPRFLEALQRCDAIGKELIEKKAVLFARLLKEHGVRGVVYEPNRGTLTPKNIRITLGNGRKIVLTPGWLELLDNLGTLDTIVRALEKERRILNKKYNLLP